MVWVQYKKATAWVAFLLWWQDPDLNWGHKAFQASALPTELSRH